MIFKIFFIYLLTGLVSIIFSSNNCTINTYKGSFDGKEITKITLKINQSGDVLGYYVLKDNKIPLKGFLSNNTLILSEQQIGDEEFSKCFSGVLDKNMISGIWQNQNLNQKQKINFTLENSSEGLKKNVIYEGVYLRNKNRDSLKICFINDSEAWFELSIGTETGCSGGISGIIKFENLKGLYTENGCESLKLYLLTNKIKVNELNCSFHGMQCSFEGEYFK
jgi:hypothetical protein